MTDQKWKDTQQKYALYKIDKETVNEAENQLKDE